MSANTARTPNDEPSARPGNKPADEVRVGNVKIAIWRNTGSSGDFYTASSPQISYKDEQGNWKEGSSYSMVYEGLLAASSKGKYFNGAIRGHFPHSRVPGTETGQGGEA